MSNIETTERPTQYDSRVIEGVAKKLLSGVVSWLQGEEADEGEVLEQLTEALDSRIDQDGYALARELERDGWVPDSDLVDILDGVGHYVYEIRMELVKQWVRENNIQPQLTIGSRVSCGRYKIVGMIANIHHDTGEYIVQEDDRQYPKPSLIKQPDGTTKQFICGTIIPYEVASPISGETDESRETPTG